jgi:hypothetical protein
LNILDAELYKNLIFLKEFEGDSSVLGLTFSVVDPLDNSEVELIPNGTNIIVNNTNKFKYIYLMSNYKLNE